MYAWTTTNTNTQLELARCLLDPKCLANIICLNTCNGRADEVRCMQRPAFVQDSS